MILTNNNKFIYIINIKNNFISVHQLSIHNLRIEYTTYLKLNETISNVCIASSKSLIISTIPSFTSRSKSKNYKIENFDPIITILDSDYNLSYYQIKENQIIKLNASSKVNISDNERILNINSCHDSLYTSVISKKDSTDAYSLSIYYPNSNKWGSDLEVTLKSNEVIKSFDWLYLSEFNECKLALINFGSHVKIIMSSNLNRWKEVCIINLPEYENGIIDHSCFLFNASIALISKYNIYIYSMLHLLSKDLIDADIDGPLRQLSIYELASDFCGPLNNYHPNFIKNCIQLGESVSLP